MKDKIIYKREVKFHTAEDTPTSYTLEIRTWNNFVEFSMCGEHGQNDFVPKDGVQKSLHKLWEDWHIKKYCELEDEDKTKELKYLCEDICNAIEEEEEGYLESLEEVTEEDVLKETCDERLIALIKHLGIEFKEYEDITEAKYGTGTYEYGNQEYQILTDSEADDEEYEAVENLIDDCYLAEYERNMSNSPLLQYLDKSRWISDWCNNRGENLSGYDGSEYMENVNNTDYFIYRKN